MRYLIAALGLVFAGWALAKIQHFKRHQCLTLVRSCKGISGMILKCETCGDRYVITWPEMVTLMKDVKLGDPS